MDNLIIKKACIHDFDKVMEFYDDVCDALVNAEYSPGWKKGIYPYPDDVYDAISQNTMYIAYRNEKIISCMIVNHEYNEEYKKIMWEYDDLDEDIYVIHMLAVHPSLQSQGICKYMIDYVKDMANDHHVKSLRLDILKGHLPAKKAYEKCGFVFKGSVEMYYEDTGKTYYDVYEYRMKEV